MGIQSIGRLELTGISDDSVAVERISVHISTSTNASYVSDRIRIEPGDSVIFWLQYVMTTDSMFLYRQSGYKSMTEIPAWRRSIVPVECEYNNTKYSILMVLDNCRLILTAGRGKIIEYDGIDEKWLHYEFFGKPLKRVFIRDDEVKVTIMWYAKV